MIIAITRLENSPEQLRYTTLATQTHSPILLLENGVYQYAALRQTHQNILVAKSDAEARGVICDEAVYVDDKGIVALTQQYGNWITLK